MKECRRVQRRRSAALECRNEPAGFLVSRISGEGTRDWLDGRKV